MVRKLFRASLGNDYNQLIEMSVEAALDLTGLELPQRQSANLVSAIAMPRAMYAAVRVDSTIPSSFNPYELLSLGGDETGALQSAMRANLLELLPLQGNQLLEFVGTRIDSISDRPAIVTEYRRSGPKGPVFVQMNIIVMPDQDVHIVLSYRESEAALWKPVIGRIRQSITISSRR